MTNLQDLPFELFEKYGRGSPVEKCPWLTYSSHKLLCKVRQHIHPNGYKMGYLRYFTSANGSNDIAGIEFHFSKENAFKQSDHEWLFAVYCKYGHLSIAQNNVKTEGTEGEDLSYVFPEVFNLVDDILKENST